MRSGRGYKSLAASDKTACQSTWHESPINDPRQTAAEILAIADEDIEGVELHLDVMLAAVQAVEVRPAIDAQRHGLTIDHEGRVRLRSAASDISGKRSLQ